MKLLKPFMCLTATLFLMSATTCTPEGTDTGNPLQDDYGQCGVRANNGSVSTSCVATPAPVIHAGYTCKKLHSCFNQVSEETCYDNVMITPGLGQEIAINVDTFKELFKLYTNDKTVTYDSNHFQNCLDVLQKTSCDDPLIQNALKFEDGKTDYSNVHSLIHVDPSCKLIYSFK